MARPSPVVQRPDRARSPAEVENAFRDMERIIHQLVECYAVPHTRMCMRWERPTRADYRQEVVSWLEDYAKSFRRLPEVTLPSKGSLPTFARTELDREIDAIISGKNVAVERSYDHLFR